MRKVHSENIIERAPSVRQIVPYGIHICANKPAIHCGFAVVVIRPLRQYG